MKQFGKYLSALFLSLTLITAVGCASTSKQEGMGEYVDDSVLTAKVKAAIFAEPGLKTLQISVVTVKGVVTLSGSVDSLANSERAKGLALAVSGVKNVDNQLVLKTS